MSIDIHRVRESEVDDAWSLARDLTVHDRTELGMTPEALCTALFHAPPRMFGHIAVLDHSVAGMALWYPVFNVYYGAAALHLEALFVSRAARGSGLGRGLLRELAAECERQRLSRLQWTVMTYNTSAIGFYRNIGATSEDEEMNFGIEGEALHALAR